MHPVLAPLLILHELLPDKQLLSMLRVGPADEGGRVLAQIGTSCSQDTILGQVELPGPVCAVPHCF